MAVRGILVDKDGTLIDFRATWLAAFQGAAAELAGLVGLGPVFAATLLARTGYDAETDSFAESNPLLWATNRAIAEDWAGEPELAGCAEAAAVAEAHFADETRYPPVPVGDLHALFDGLLARGLRLGVTTMDTTAKARAKLAGLGLERRLDFVAGFDGGFGEKPAPGMFHGFCAAAGVEPGEVVVGGENRGRSPDGPGGGGGDGGGGAHRGDAAGGPRSARGSRHPVRDGPLLDTC